MSKTIFPRLLLTATAVLSVGQCYAQSELQLRARQLPGWDLKQREGRCQIRLWVDDRAEVRLRGDRIWVTTLQGAKGRVTDEASAVEEMGLRPRLVTGSRENLKVTFPEDLGIAEAILQRRRPA